MWWQSWCLGPGLSTVIANKNQFSSLAQINKSFWPKFTICLISMTMFHMMSEQDWLPIYPPSLSPCLVELQGSAGASPSWGQRRLHPGELGNLSQGSHTQTHNHSHLRSDWSIHWSSMSLDCEGGKQAWKNMQTPDLNPEDSCCEAAGWSSVTAQIEEQRWRSSIFRSVFPEAASDGRRGQWPLLSSVMWFLPDRNTKMHILVCQHSYLKKETPCLTKVNGVVGWLTKITCSAHSPLQQWQEPGSVWTSVSFDLLLKCFFPSQQESVQCRCPSLIDADPVFHIIINSSDGPFD